MCGYSGDADYLCLGSAGWALVYHTACAGFVWYCQLAFRGWIGIEKSRHQIAWAIQQRMDCFAFLKSRELHEVMLACKHAPTLCLHYS